MHCWREKLHKLSMCGTATVCFNSSLLALKQLHCFCTQTIHTHQKEFKLCKTLVMYLKTILEVVSPSCPWIQLVGAVETSTHLFITCLHKSLSARSERDLNLACVSLSLPVLALGADYHHILATATGYFVALVICNQTPFFTFEIKKINTSNKTFTGAPWRVSNKNIHQCGRDAGCLKSFKFKRFISKDGIWILVYMLFSFFFYHMLSGWYKLVFWEPLLAPFIGLFLPRRSVGQPFKGPICVI